MQPVDLLLVTVKAHQLEEALEQVDPAAVADAVVLPLLNGLEHVELLRARFGPRIAAGSLGHFEAYRAGRVQIIQTTPSGTIAMASEELPGRAAQGSGGHADERWFRGARWSRTSGRCSGARRRVRRCSQPRRRSRTAPSASCSTTGRGAPGSSRRSRRRARSPRPTAPRSCPPPSGPSSAPWTTTSRPRPPVTWPRVGRPSSTRSPARSCEREQRLGVPCPALDELYAEAVAHAAETAEARR